MADGAAKIVVGADITAATKALDELKRGWKDAGSTIASGWQAVANTIGSSVQSTVQSVGRIATAADLISFEGAVKSSLDFKDAVGRMAVGASKDARSVKESFLAVGQAILSTPQQVQSATRAINKSFYDLDKSTSIIKAIGTEGVLGDRTLDELSQFALLLGRGSSSASDMQKQLDKLRGTAAALGTKGGATALMDWGNKSAGMLSHMTGTVSSGAQGNAMAVRAALGKSLPPHLADEAASGLVGDLVNDPTGWETMMGLPWGTVTDENGQLKMSPTQAFSKAKREVLKLHGGNAKAARATAQMTLGRTAGAALMREDWDAIGATADTAKPVGTDMVRMSGKELEEARARAAAAAGAIRAGDAVTEPMGPVREFFSKHPRLSMAADKAWGLAADAGGWAATTGATLAGMKMLGAYGASGSAAAGASAGMVTLGALAAGGAGVLGGGLGYGIASAVDQIGNIGAPEGADWSLTGMFAQRLNERMGGAVTEPLTPEILASFGAMGGGDKQASAAAVMGDAVGAAVVDALSRGDTKAIQITVMNYTGGPIEAVENASASQSKQGG